MDDKRKTWEEKLGTEISDELRLELGGIAAADDPPMRVYLNTGQVDEVRPASAIEMTGDRLNVTYKDKRSRPMPAPASGRRARTTSLPPSGRASADEDSPT